VSGGKRGPGRPAFAEGTAKTGVFAIRLSDDERAAIAEAAARAEKPVTQWAREALIAAAKFRTESLLRRLGAVLGDFLHIHGHIVRRRLSIARGPPTGFGLK
jgi:hypothetical protein